MLLIEDFKTIKNKYIEQGYDENIVNSYINKFKIITQRYSNYLEKVPNLTIPISDRKNIDKYEDFRDLEAVVDFLTGYISKHKLIDDKEKIELKNSYKIYDNEQIEIFKGTTPEACILIKGSENISWCISKPESNLFYHYRFEDYSPTVYFIKQKNETSENPYYFFVFFVTKNNDDYRIISSLNKPGEEKIPFSWLDVVKKFPFLSKLKKLFVSDNYSEEEVFAKSKSRGVSDDEYITLSYNHKNALISGGIILSDKQFINTPYPLIKNYLLRNLNINDVMMNHIKKDKDTLKYYGKLIIDDFLSSIENIYGFQYKKIYSFIKPEVIFNILNDFNNFNEGYLNMIIANNKNFSKYFIENIEMYNNRLNISSLIFVIYKNKGDSDIRNKIYNVISEKYGGDPLNHILNNTNISFLSEDYFPEMKKFLIKESEKNIESFLNTLNILTEKFIYISDTKKINSAIEYFCPFLNKMFKKYGFNNVLGGLTNMGRSIPQHFYLCVDIKNEFNLYDFVTLNSDIFNQFVVKERDGNRLGVINDKGVIILPLKYKEIGSIRVNKEEPYYRIVIDFNDVYYKVYKNGDIEEL
jgi:hypothetical protein